MICHQYENYNMIFLDIDDTLLDHKSSQDKAALIFSELYKERLIVEQNMFVKFWDEISRNHMNKYLLGNISFQEQRRERIKSSISADLSDREADTIFDDYHSAYRDSWQLFPDCLEALELLKNCRLGVITNGDPNQQYYKLRKLGIDKYFEFIVTPHDAGKAKPSPLIFKYASRISGVSPEFCWYVGDDYQKDYTAAKKENWNSVWLNRNSNAKPSKDVCNNLVQFAQLVT